MDKLLLLFQWKGKINRKFFLLFIFLSILLSIVFAFIEKIISPNEIGIFLLLLIYLLLVTFAKRMRDIHLSLWYLISFPIALFSKQLVFIIAKVLNIDLYRLLLSNFPNEMTLNPQSVMSWILSPFWIPSLIVFIMLLSNESKNEKV